jgi:hypothetical protein
MQETLEPQTSPRLSNWRTEWNIADLLRAADAEEPVEEQTFLQNSELQVREADWAETGNLLAQIAERVRRNNSRLAELEAANRELEFGLARQVHAVSSRMKLLERLAERAELARAAAEDDAEHAEARAALAQSWLMQIADATRHQLAAALASSEPTRCSGPVFPTQIAPQYASEPPGKARLRTCLDQYNANKVSDANGGLKWIEPGGGYFGACNNRLKS